MKTRRILFYCVLVFLLTILSVPACAEWKKNSSGKYVFYNENGKALKGTWVSSEKAGLVTVNGKLCCFRQDGSPYHGFIDVSSSKRYYADKNGQILMGKWISLKSSGTTKKYRAGKDGVIYRGKIVKVGNEYYGFDKNGVLTVGKKKYGANYYFFRKNTGRMVRKQYIVSDGKRYYAKKNGVLAVNKWVGRYYFGKYAKALSNGWVGNRYVGSDGKYLTGLKKIGNYFYYFDDNTGEKITGTSKTVKGNTFYFNEQGRSSGNSRLEDQYYSDPSVSDEDLLAAIIYCESGNQPYYGQLAVGLVITNRVRSSQFPSTLKEVVYAKQQFEPARTGVLTNCLKNSSMVTDSCKKAAKKVLSMYKAGSYTITVNKKKISLKNYLFFMTPSAYARLGLSSPVLKLEGHVFFQNWY